MMFDFFRKFMAQSNLELEIRLDGFYRVGPHAGIPASRLPKKDLILNYEFYDNLAPLPGQAEYLVKHIRRVLQSCKKTRLKELTDQEHERVIAIFSMCYDKRRQFKKKLRGLKNRTFTASLLAERHRLLVAMSEQRQQDQISSLHFVRFPQCQSAPIDLAGEGKLDLLKQMSPDDWHEIFMHWNWHNRPREILEWAISNPQLDRATAVHIFFHGDPTGFTSPEFKYGTDPESKQHIKFLAELSSKIRSGFFQSQRLKLTNDIHHQVRWKKDLHNLTELNNPVFIVPQDVLDDKNKVVHSPKYSWDEGTDEIVYDYEYWLKHVAKPAKWFTAAKQAQS